MEQTKNNIMDKANGIAHDFNNKIQTGEKRLEKLSGQIVEKAEDTVSDIAKSASAYVQTSREYVQDNPMKSVAIAATAGLVAGGLLTMALRRKN